MHEQISKQAREMWAAATKTEIPDAIRSAAQDSVAKASEALAQWQTVARQGSKAFEDISLATQSGAKAVGEQVLGNTIANAEAGIAAAQKVVAARTIPEAAQLQAKFLQDQAEAWKLQSKELAELSLKVARETADALTASVAKMTGELKPTV